MREATLKDFLSASYGLSCCWPSRGITLVLLVLRGVRRIDEACVDDPPRGQPQAGIKELLVDHFKDLRAKLMLLKQMPELQDRGLIKRAVHQVQADELSRSRVL